MLAKIRKLVDSSLFQNSAMFLVIFYSILIGVGLYFPGNQLIELLDNIIIWLFVTEISLRMIAVWSLKKFFLDAWNTFDFVLVFSTFIPGIGSTLAASRVLRVLRVLRVVKAIPELRFIISTLLNSFKSMIYIALLAAILFYVYGVIGTTIFGEISPQFFGSLHRTILTLFEVMTLAGWVEIMDSVEQIGIVSRFYFISFIGFGTFVIINLFIAVIIDKIQSEREENKKTKAESKNSKAQGKS